MIYPPSIDRRSPVDFAAMDRDSARAAHPLFVLARFRTTERYTIAPPPSRYRPVRDAAEALRRIVTQGAVELQDGRFFLTIELTEALEDFLATFDAAAEDLEEDDPAEPNGDEGDFSEGLGFPGWQGGSAG